MSMNDYEPIPDERIMKEIMGIPDTSDECSLSASSGSQKIIAALSEVAESQKIIDRAKEWNSDGHIHALKTVDQKLRLIHALLSSLDI